MDWEGILLRVYTKKRKEKKRKAKESSAGDPLAEPFLLISTTS